MQIHNKLVRDKIPEILSNKNISYSTRTLTEEEFEIELQNKLSEELGELESEAKRDQVSRADIISELADCIEVIRAIQLTCLHSSAIVSPAYSYIEEVYHNNGIAWSEIVARQAEKKQERGAFTEKIFLISTED